MGASDLTGRLGGRLLRLLEPEQAHRAAVLLLKTGTAAAALGTAGRDPASLATRVWGLDFPNPVGLAAGFDKSAEVADAALALGFGFVEVGSVTPRPQPGNPKPRLFRLTEDRAIINRMGFNNEGLAAVAERLARRQRLGGIGGRRTSGIVGANLGKNKDTEDAAADYESGALTLAPLADYLVINVSSPNTPGLRALQGRAPLAALIGRTRAALDRAVTAEGHRPPLLLKIAPDLTPEDRADIAAVALDGGIDGLIATNTTIGRPPGLRGKDRAETGGLSGRPLFALSTEVLADMYRLTGGTLPIIGVGGIGSGADAFAKIRAGASLVQVYSALVYEGPGLVARIKAELAALLQERGYRSVAEAVGADHRLSARPAP